MKRKGPKPRITEDQRRQLHEACILDLESARVLAASFGFRRNYADEYASQNLLLKPKIGRRGGKPIPPRAYEACRNDPRWQWAIARGAVRV